MTDIVERLRAEGADKLHQHYSIGMWRLCADAADEIERLRAGGCARDQTTTQYCAEVVERDAEITRLRAALQHVLDNADHDSHRFTDIEMIKVVKAVLPSPP